MSREVNSGHNEAGGLVKGTAMLMKLFNGPSMSQEENNSCPSKASGESGTAALVERRADCEGAHEPKLLFGVPVDEAIMKITTGLRMCGKESYKNRLHRAGTSWIRGQKLPLVRLRKIKKLKSAERDETMQEDEEKKKDKKTREGREKKNVHP